jgi:hypothetical protein
MDRPSFEEILDGLQGQVRRQAIVIERLATEFHALLIVLAQKKVTTLDEVRAAERRLDLASEVARARAILDATRDLESFDAALDEDDRRREAG